MGFIVAVDLGQTRDFTAIAVLEWTASVSASGKPERRYLLRYLDRPPLGTPYTSTEAASPGIVQQVLAVLRRAPLVPSTPLVVDKTGVGAPVIDMFKAVGLKPHALTITGGDTPNTQDLYDLRVPKRDLAALLVALYQGRRLKMAPQLPLAQVLVKELLDFKVKVNIATGNDSYEAWRESTHDDLVLSVAMGCWWAEHGMGRPWRSAAAGERPAVTQYRPR